MHVAIRWVLWLAGGCAAFSIFVLVLFKSGAVSRTRNERAELRRDLSLKRILTLVVVMAVFCAVILAFDYTMFVRQAPGFWRVLWYNAIFVMALVCFDSFVIDLWVIGRLRPKILDLPPEMNMDAMKAHVARQFTVGWVFVAPLIILSAAAFYVLFG